MGEGRVVVFTGEGRGKTPAALGTALMFAAQGKKSVVIQFLKGKAEADNAYFRRLEPEITIFRFERCEFGFEDRTQEEKETETINIRNGLNFARKVLTLGQCDLLVLDEVLGLVDNDIITVDELRSLVELRGEAGIVLTGKVLNTEICSFADEISEISHVQFKNFDS